MKKIKQPSKKERWHYTAPYLLNPQHPVTVNVIGAGGSGSRVLTELARMDHALKHLGHPGLHVTCYDGDIVTDANLGRQLFSQEDLGLNKAVVYVTRINQFMGTAWDAKPFNYERKSITRKDLANITISCVDTIDARKKILGTLTHNAFRDYNNDPYSKTWYWLDMGNTQKAGQFIIGTCDNNYNAFVQPEPSPTLHPVDELPHIFLKYPDLEDQKVKDTGPSCSLPEALSKQDLFVNSTLVQLAIGMIWKMFREGRINYHGAFMNLQTLSVAPISV